MVSECRLEKRINESYHSLASPHALNIILKDQGKEKLHLKSLLPLWLIGKCHWVPLKADSETKMNVKKAC